MSALPCRLAALLLSAACTLPAGAASTASVSASDAASLAVGSVSDSFKRSSDSSSRRDKVAEGDYRIVEVAAVADRPGVLRLTLKAEPGTAEDDELLLFLPQATAQQAGLAAGHVVRAKQRPYGTEFARAGTGQAFYLVLEDSWHRELPSRPVSL